MFHPNCKDSTSTYYEGITTLKPVTEDELDDMKRIDALEQQKKYYESRAQKCARVAKFALDPDNRRTYAARAKANEEKAAAIAEKLPETVDYSADSGIITSYTEMHRKSHKGKIEPMPKKQFHRLEKSFKRRGGLFQYDERTDIYLENKHAEGITLNSTTILIKRKPGRASVFEELIHAHQYRVGKNDGSYLSRLNCEIDAQRELIRHSRLFQLTDIEVEQTKAALAEYENELLQYYKGGE